MSKYLVTINRPTLTKSQSVVKNSKEFIVEAKTWTISPDEIQVSYDVPVENAISNLMDMLQTLMISKLGQY